MDFLQQLGAVALGSRLRRLGERFATDGAELFKLYGVGIQPKWFPVFLLLARQGESSITAMAQSIGCSHPVVSQIVKEMAAAGLAATQSSPEDARVNLVSLSGKGLALVPGLEQQMRDVEQAVDEMLGSMRHDLWNGIEEMEYLLDERSFLARVRDKRKERLAREVEIVDYAPEHREDFRRLNREWIEKYFEMEEADHKALDHPEEKILRPGGCILLARLHGRMVGCCGLARMDHDTYELVKLAVTESAQGRNIGRLLCEAILDRAAALGARTVYIESNTRLKAAGALYRKLGFRKVAGRPSPYARCNIQMELDLAARSG